jgi:2-desacetyl-2-hydroxyethyl bacteriochlorophyllide A dehydrogenase
MAYSLVQSAPLVFLAENMIGSMARTRSTTFAGTFARALWITAPSQAEIRSAPLDSPGREEALVRTSWSLISRGTERLVFHGEVGDAGLGMSAPFQEGNFAFPIKYGYACVGIVEEGPEAWRGKTVFCLHPHQDMFVVPVCALFPVPVSVPSRRAALAATMETALNAVWDGVILPCDKVIVIGSGQIGLLVAALCARIPGTSVTVIDPDCHKQTLVESLGCLFSPDAEGVEQTGTVFHASATQAGLATAFALTADEGNVIELSWYGQRPISVRLGSDFHSRRLRLISSQVGRVSASRRHAFTPANRLAKALTVLDDPRLDALLTHETPFEILPQTLPRIFDTSSSAPSWLIRY